MNPAILGAVLLSGAAALTYEVLWLRMLARAFGVTVYAVSFLVAIFFAGLAAGSWAAARARGVASWLRVYALVELGAALGALAATAWFARLPELLAGTGWSSGWGGGDLARVFLYAGPALLLPTALWGAALPAIARHWLGGREQLGRRAGLLYAANTLGAVLGALGSGFWAIAAFGEKRTALLASGLGAAAAALAWTLGGPPVPVSEAEAARDREPKDADSRRTALALYGLSGLCAMGFEVLWTRKLTMLLGSSVYAFSLFLGTLLTGTALGSAAWARWGQRAEPWRAFGRLGLLLSALAAASLVCFDALSLANASPDYLYSPLNRAGDLWRMALHAAVVVLPSAVVMGMLFPAAARLAEEPEAGRAVGAAYAWNTAGGVLGSLGAGFAGLALLGVQGTFLALCALGAAGALTALARTREKPRLGRAEAALLGALALALLAAARDRSLDAILRRAAGAKLRPPSVLFHDEHPAGTATGLAFGGRDAALLLDGIVTAGTGSNGALMSALPQALGENPSRYLVVGLGAGVTVRSAARMGSVDCVELLPPVARRVGVFQPGFEGTPGARVILGDGRNYLLRTGERYDVVIVDGSPPLFRAGTVNLYTVEFMRLVRGRLAPGGIYALWLPFPGFRDDFRHILGGVAAVFPHWAVWKHPDLQGGFLVFAAESPFPRDAALIEKRLAERVRPRVLPKLDAGIVLAGFAAGEAAVAAGPLLEPVTDDRPRTEFPLGRFLRGERLGFEL